MTREEDLIRDAQTLLDATLVAAEEYRERAEHAEERLAQIAELLNVIRGSYPEMGAYLSEALSLARGEASS